MAKRIRNVSELPSWFNLKKYERTNKLDNAEWYEQLIMRQYCLAFLEYWNSYPSKQRGIKKNLIKEALEAIRINPLASITNDQRLLVFNPFNAFNHSKSYLLGVHPITIREFLQTKDRISQDKLNYAEKHFQENHIKQQSINYPYMDWIDEPTSKLCAQVPTLVNFSFSDEVLMEHFKYYLKDCRKKINLKYIGEPCRKPDFPHWIRFQVLPYLDLKIWESETQILLSNRILASALFPNGEAGEETIRKTITPLAKTLMSERFLDHLAANVVQKIPEGKTS